MVNRPSIRLRRQLLGEQFYGVVVVIIEINHVGLRVYRAMGPLRRDGLGHRDDAEDRRRCAGVDVLGSDHTSGDRKSTRLNSSHFPYPTLFRSVFIGPWAPCVVTVLGTVTMPKIAAAAPVSTFLVATTPAEIGRAHV